jgi:hypothetical protein
MDRRHVTVVVCLRDIWVSRHEFPSRFSPLALFFSVQFFHFYLAVLLCLMLSYFSTVLTTALTVLNASCGAEEG